MSRSFSANQVFAHAFGLLCGCQIHLLIAVLMLAQAILSGQAQAKDPSRERMSLNAGWKFTKDDPKDAEGKLDYAKIKDWVTQTGQSFLKEPKQPATKPEGDLGADVSYTKSDFDDSACANWICRTTGE